MIRLESLALCLAVTLTASAQSMQAPTADPPTPTLHVYMDLIQVPVLVLDTFRGRMKPVDTARFRVSLDSGPEFKPRHVRLEGDDPITLGILLDVNSDQASLMPTMNDAVAGLAPHSLHAADHVSIYTVDCKLTRTSKDMPADATELHAGVDRALQPWLAERKDRHRAPCDRRVGLWDAIRLTTLDLAGLPGRRVLLVITDGVDRGTVPPPATAPSPSSWNQARETAQKAGVALFAFAPAATGPGGRFASPDQMRKASGEDPLTNVCELSGGMVISVDHYYLQKQLVRFIETIRDRYIVEFSRPRNDSPGEHNIQINLLKTPAFIRAAGVSLTMADPALRNAKDAIPTDTTDSPELGKRKPLR